MTLKIEQTGLDVSRELPSPTLERLPEFEIIETNNSRVNHSFDVTIQSGASRDEIYEAMRTKYVPIAWNNIQPIDGGFVLHFPDHISSRFAGNFFHTYWAAQLTGQQDPVNSALASLGYQSTQEGESTLHPSFYGDLIRRYYDKIDKGETDWVIAMFAPNAVYARADSKFEGREAIADFYNTGRKISGVHMVDEPIVSGDTVVIRGVFNGSGADGSSKSVRFSDIWCFEGRLVKSRETYLALGSGYVKE